MTTTVVRVVGLALWLMSLATAADDAMALVVNAGAHARQDSPVRFALPTGTAVERWRLRASDGALVAVQGDGQGSGHFVVSGLAQGEQRAFVLERDPAPAPERVAMVRTGDVVGFRVGDHDLVRYQGGAGQLPAGYPPEFRRGGYLAELRTPGGVLVTDDYPPNHKHHHGVWFTWTKTVFGARTPDFWNMGGKTGTVEAIAIDAAWGGSACGGLRVRHRHVDLGATPALPALDETWTVTVHAPLGTPSRLLVDLEVVQRCSGDQPLRLPTYHYGGLGLRGHRQWNGAQAVEFLTSEGKTRADGNQTRARWCRMSGVVDGTPASIAVFDHPANWRFPQPMRLHPTEPFFCYAPSQLGDWAIEPGTPLTLRYRLVIADGATEVGELERLWKDWAEPPTVMLRAAPKP